jgi:hypothetical protein
MVEQKSGNLTLGYFSQDNYDAHFFFKINPDFTNTYFFITSEYRKGKLYCPYELVTKTTTTTTYTYSYLTTQCYFRRDSVYTKFVVTEGLLD